MLASGDDVNVWVLDTEGCSNTGAQTSKATLTGAATKMAAGGNSAKKKDLGAIVMTVESAYVASAALSADVGQTVRAFRAAEAYKDPFHHRCLCHVRGLGPPGRRQGDGAATVQAVESGYWPIYR